jgi:hypothetical protein
VFSSWAMTIWAWNAHDSVLRLFWASWRDIFITKRFLSSSWCTSSG